MSRRIALAIMVAALGACSPAELPGPDASSPSQVSKTVGPPLPPPPPPLPPPPPPLPPTEYSGRATAVQAVVQVLFTSLTTRLGDTGPLASTGGTLRASLFTATVPGLLAAGVAQGYTTGGNSDANSQSSVANASLSVAGIGISAALLASQTDISCASGHAVANGSSAITQLLINGQRIDVTGAPNQSISLLGGLARIVINEQAATANSIDVSALHVTVAGVADVALAKTHSDITCGS